VNDRQRAADFLAGDFHDTTLLVLGAGGDFGRVGVDRDRRQAFNCPNVAQVSSKTRLVDRQILAKRQQHRRYHTLWYEIGMAAHGSSPY
jgi:hypothetical protein